MRDLGSDRTPEACLVEGEGQSGAATVRLCNEELLARQLTVDPDVAAELVVGAVDEDEHLLRDVERALARLQPADLGGSKVDQVDADGVGPRRERSSPETKGTRRDHAFRSTIDLFFGDLPENDSVGFREGASPSPNERGFCLIAQAVAVPFLVGRGDLLQRFVLRTNEAIGSKQESGQNDQKDPVGDLAVPVATTGVDEAMETKVSQDDQHRNDQHRRLNLDRAHHDEVEADDEGHVRSDLGPSEDESKSLLYHLVETDIREIELEDVAQSEVREASEKAGAERDQEDSREEGHEDPSEERHAGEDEVEDAQVIGRIQSDADSDQQDHRTPDDEEAATVEAFHRTQPVASILTSDGQHVRPIKSVHAEFLILEWLRRP